MDVNKYLAYLEKEKSASANTLTAYARDLKAFGHFMAERGGSLESATKTDVLAYLMDLKKGGRSRATANRKLAALRSAYGFMIAGGELHEDPTAGIRSSRSGRRELEYLTLEEVERLLAEPDDSIKGVRDRAILEVLYGTGIRVVELIELNIRDLNLKMGFINLGGAHGRARIVPTGSYARAALTEYMQHSRPALLAGEAVKEPDEAPLFLNYRGERFTRQGLWKVLRQYGARAGLADRLTPHILRTSFAVHMVQNGADLKTLQELMGYDDVQALQAFMEVSKSRIKNVYDRTHPRA